MDYTTGVRVPFLAYDPAADGFPASPSASPLVVGKTTKRGGVGSESRCGRRKRYRDLDAVGTDPVGSSLTPFFMAQSVNTHSFQGALYPRRSSFRSRLSK